MYSSAGPRTSRVSTLQRAIYLSIEVLVKVHYLSHKYQLVFIMEVVGQLAIYFVWSYISGLDLR